MTGEKGIDLLLADFCASDKLKIVAKGKDASGKIVMGAIQQYRQKKEDVNYDNVLDSIKRITLFGYWVRRRLLRYRRVDLPEGAER